MASDNTFLGLGFEAAPGNRADVLIPNDVSTAKAKLAELKADKAFQDVLLSPLDPRQDLASRIWRSLHVVASRG